MDERRKYIPADAENFRQKEAEPTTIDSFNVFTAPEPSKTLDDPQMDLAKTLVEDWTHFLIKRYCEEGLSPYDISGELRRISDGEIRLSPARIRTALKVIGAKLRTLQEAKAALWKVDRKREAQLYAMNSSPTREKHTAPLKEIVESPHIGAIRINSANRSLYEWALAAGLLEQLPERHRNLLDLRYGRNLSLEKTGVMVGAKSRQRASQLEQRALKRLRKLLVQLSF